MKLESGDIIVIGEDGFAVRDGVLDVQLVIEVPKTGYGGLYLIDGSEDFKMPVRDLHPRLLRKVVKLGKL